MGQLQMVTMYRILVLSARDGSPHAAKEHGSPMQPEEQRNVLKIDTASEKRNMQIIASQVNQMKLEFRYETPDDQYVTSDYYV